MEVVEQLDYLVTNAEVMELLRDVEKEAKSTGFKRPWTARETSQHVMAYLETVPSCNTSPPEVDKLMQSLSNFSPLHAQEPLRETEILNIANLRPTSVVALFAMIDKSLDRFGEDKLDEMLTIVNEILTAPPDLEEGAEEGIEEG
eukprot:CAMPEP_0179452204 /NCGR_PEP_ID=MMETSP0799-20121207/36104_1 /TAXON_ID=46947 /ORGANISM="Geminigera cryophila, Strain CCMP2564" /LENGTH=144 /DNA_ID=CAMNT_0021247921 /DNA_START=166 /DNA_END=597 /DNA_ORIENTATION=-